MATQDSLPPSRPAPEVPGKTLAPTKVWVSTAYFAEGLPYMLVRYLFGVYLTDLGVKEAWLGFLNFLGVPWNFKFLWAPIADLWGNKRTWLLWAQGTVALAALVLGLFAALGPTLDPTLPTASIQSNWALNASMAVIVLLAFLAATHDITIDAFYMEAIPNPGEQAAYTGLRVMTYRLAIIFAKSVLVALASWASWAVSFWVGGACMGLLLLFHARFLPTVRSNSELREESANAPGERARRKLSSPLAEYGRAFFSYLRQPRVAIILAFVITYKLGDEILFSMNTPFLMRELGISKEAMSWMAGLLGTGASIAGSLLSAWAIKRFGFRKAVWPLTLCMNVNIGAYIWLAWSVPDAASTAGLVTVAAVHAYEQFAAGLGNAVLVVYIMRTCLPEFKAAHYAVATAISSLGGTFMGGFGGVVVEQFGYVTLFSLAFAASIPSMALLLFLPHKDS